MLAHIEQLFVGDKGIEWARVEAAERDFDLQGEEAQLRGAYIGVHAANQHP